MNDETDNPVADLIGYTVTINDQPWMVVGVPAWNDGGTYVVLENEDERTIIRPTGVVRRYKELMALEAATVRAKKPTLPLFDSGDPTLGEEASRLFGGPES